MPTKVLLVCSAFTEQRLAKVYLAVSFTVRHYIPSTTCHRPQELHPYLSLTRPRAYFSMLTGGGGAPQLGELLATKHTKQLGELLATKHRG